MMNLDKEKLTKEVGQFLEGLLKGTGLDLEFDCQPEGQVITVWLSGNDASMVVSNNGRLLYAINHLLNRAFYERSPQQCNFVVECNDYRATREAELEELARTIAERVKVSGDLFPLDPMPASERRVIHLALAEEPGVRTESEGTGIQRRVVILPAS
jgi:spoIIIJ-associated protein